MTTRKIGISCARGAECESTMFRTKFNVTDLWKVSLPSLADVSLWLTSSSSASLVNATAGSQSEFSNTSAHKTKSMLSSPIDCPAPSHSNVYDDIIIDSEMMVQRYNQATWRMYNRIVQARQATHNKSYHISSSLKPMNQKYEYPLHFQTEHGSCDRNPGSSKFDDDGIFDFEM